MGNSFVVQNKALPLSLRNEKPTKFVELFRLAENRFKHY